MTRERIIIDVAPDATVTVTVEGCKGSGCHKLTADIERAIGKTTEDRRTPEYHQQGGSHAQHQH